MNWPAPLHNQTPVPLARLACLLLMGFAFASSAAAAPVYSIVPLGLDDLEHTRSDGNKYSYAYDLKEAGQVRGSSQRYNGGSTGLGLSAWLYNGATTIGIGLTGAEHTGSDGYQYSRGFQLNEAGQVRGSSQRYNGSTYVGQSTWLYNGAATLDIGLTGAEHTRNDGYKDSRAFQLNEAGQVSGLSSRYNGGSTHLGVSAWLYNGVTTIGIGLTGAEHTRSEGYKRSVAEQLNEAGQVRGSSQRYNGSTYVGQSTWLYNGAATLDIGLTGAEHTRNDGYKDSRAFQLNEAGQVTGYSSR